MADEKDHLIEVPPSAGDEVRQDRERNDGGDIHEDTP